jgi:hypothetical protein
LKKITGLGYLKEVDCIECAGSGEIETKEKEEESDRETNERTESITAHKKKSKK